MPTDKSATEAAMDGLGKVAAEAYADLAKPAARQLGSALETLFKVGLAPLAMLDWGFERSKVWLRTRMEERIAQIPPDCRTAPPSHVALPILVQIATCADAPELRDLYAELLMKAMDVRTLSRVHPAYVSLISQLSPPEALVLLSFNGKADASLFSESVHLNYRDSPPTIEQQFEAHCKALGFEGQATQVWLDNLQRLGVLAMERYSDVSLRGEDVDLPARVDTIESRNLYVTEFGRAFVAVCTPTGGVHEV